jgi:hypothetical protein
MIDLIKDEIYIVIEKCDKSNNPDWWLVEFPDICRGYVPRSYLKVLD